MSRKRRNSSPLDQTALRDLALSYVARFSTTQAKLADYLRRKIRERGVAEDTGELDVQAVVERLVELKYVDDAAFAQARSASLLRKGYGGRRVEQALRAAGIAESTRGDFAPDDVNARRSALLLVRKRGFGPFGRDFGTDERLDLAKREKQIAAMVRAGHDFGTAKALIDAASVEDAEQWVQEAEEWHDDAR